MAVYYAKVVLFPEAPPEIREFPTLKEAKTWARHRKLSLKHEYYTIKVGMGEVDLEILIGNIYRGLH